MKKNILKVLVVALWAFAGGMAATRYIAALAAPSTIEPNFLAVGASVVAPVIPIAPKMELRNQFGFASSDATKYKLAVELLIELAELHISSNDAILTKANIQLTKDGLVIFPRP